MVVNKYLAELIGTAILVGLGSMGILAVGGATGAAEILAIGLAFGLALLAGIWALGHVSGAHFNPAVTLAMLVDGRISLTDSIGYWVAQFVGGVFGSLIVLGAAGEQSAVAATATTYQDLSTAIVSEIVLTIVFVWVILTTTRYTRSRGHHAPLTISLTLVGIHLAGIPFSGASVNPARSFGPALVGGAFGSDIWVYLYAPMIGALLAYGLHRLFPVVDTEDEG